jgi:hypothetical protein
VVAANQAATLSMSAPERALADADHITPTMLDLVKDSDLGSLENRGFVGAFVGSLPASERVNLTGAGGGLSAEGLTRVGNAILAKAYGDADTHHGIDRRREVDLQRARWSGPTWAKMRAEIDAGRTPEELDITPDLMEADNACSTWLRNWRWLSVCGLPAMTPCSLAVAPAAALAFRTR